MSSPPKSARVATASFNGKQRRRKARGVRGVTTLMYAAQQGNVESVRKIIQNQESSLYKRDRTGKTPLHYCCTSDNICAAHAADLMVMAAPDLLDGKDEDGFTPLHLAVIAGNMQLVTFLLANNADVNAVDNEKHTVVHWATVCGETAALRAILAAGAPVSTPDVHGGYPLHYAAQMCGGDRDSSLGLQVLQTLLSHNDIVVSVADGDKRQPLLWAASAGSARAVLALVRAGANVEAADKDGLTALHCAASRGHTDCMDTLLTLCGASIDVIDSNGCTALHYAVTLGHADATALLLAHGADPNRQDRKGRSPAHCGCAKGQFETVKLIGTHGANLWLRNARGDLPLHDAAASGRRELVKWLLEMRPSHVNARNNDGRCPLHMAALNDNADMCKILLDAGAQINPVLRTSKNVFMTPLDCALQRGFRSTAKYLQLHGGIPATRLGDPRNQPINTAINLQMRDDMTLWGGSSSDSERENGEVEHNGRKMLKKKLSYKYGRRKLSLSGSDGDSAKHKNVTENPKEKSSSRTSDKKSSPKQEHVSTSVRSSSRKLPSSRLDYTNEIIINGKTEINIRQTEEIFFDKETETADVTNQRAVSSKIAERDRRPRSAKHSRVRDRSGKQATDQDSRTKFDKTTSPETIIQQEESRKLSLKDQSTNTSEETAETVIENKKFAAVQTTISEEEITVVEKNQQEASALDQQSLMSYTSEDMEEQKKELVVEASVHSPPKSLETTEVQVPVTQDIGKGGDVLEDNSVDTITKNEVPEGHEDKDQSNETQQEERAEEQEPTELEANIASDTATMLNEDSTMSVGTKKEDVKEESTENVGVNSIGEKTDTDNAVQVQKDNELDLKRTEDAADGGLNEHELGNSVSTDMEKHDVIVDGIEHSTDVHFGEEVGKEADGTSGVEEKLDATTDEQLGKKKDLDETVGVDTDIVPLEVEIGKGAKKDVEEPKKAEADEPIVMIETKDSMLQGETKTKDVVEVLGPEDKMIDGRRKVMKNDENAAEPGVTVEPKGSLVLDKTETKDVVEVLGPEHKKTGRRRKVTKNDVKILDQQQLSSSFSDEGVITASERTHKSFRILDEREAAQLKKSRGKGQKSRKSPMIEVKSHSRKPRAVGEENEKNRRSKIPTPLFKSTLSKSDRHLNEIGRDTNLDLRVPSLPNISDVRHRQDEPTRCESNMSAPLLKSVYSDNERDSFSEGEELRKVTKNRRRVKKRSRTRESRSAGSDYESSNLIDSGFEPSPRSTRIPRWKNMSERGVNMTSVTQNIQNNIRRYHLERKIFQQLLELKRHQIRAGQHNEAVLVKRAIDTYHQSCASTVGAGRYIAEDYTFKSFEKFLYEALRKLQKNGAEYLRGLPATQSNPLLCTRSTNKCMHAMHAYTGVPCAAYLPRMDHHSIPKIGFNSVNCKPGTGFLPTINPKKAVTLELSHGTDKQVISLPTDRLDQNKRYYVTFTVKGHEAPPSEGENGSNSVAAHTHPKSD